MDKTRAHHHNRAVAAAVFTTLSATSVLEKIRNQVRAGTVAPVDFNLGTNGERTVFRFNPGVSAIPPAAGDVELPDAVGGARLRWPRTLRDRSRTAER